MTGKYVVYWMYDRDCELIANKECCEEDFAEDWENAVLDYEGALRSFESLCEIQRKHPPKRSPINVVILKADGDEDEPIITIVKRERFELVKDGET